MSADRKATSNLWKRNHKERHAELARAYRRRNPEKLSAQNQLNYAVKKGLMIRGDCEGCGTSQRVHAHHEDYAKPLDVHWLCYLCHKAAHPVTEEAKKVKFFGARPAGPKGEDHHAHKLTDMGVRVIHRLLDAGVSQTSIGRVFGVWQSTISMIRHGKIWTHIPTPTSQAA